MFLTWSAGVCTRDSVRVPGQVLLLALRSAPTGKDRRVIVVEDQVEGQEVGTNSGFRCVASLSPTTFERFGLAFTHFAFSCFEPTLMGGRLCLASVEIGCLIAHRLAVRRVLSAAEVLRRA